MTAVVHSVDGRHSGDIISAPGRGRDRLDRLVPVVLGCIVLLAWSTVSPAGYWADEGIALDIAALPLTEIPSALRLDVSPPFYYLVLHCWMTLFGSSEMATNGCSLVAGLLAIGVAWRLGKVVAGARLGILLSLIVAASPRFFLNTTETRMYTFAILLGLLALLGWWRCLVLGQRQRAPALGLLMGSDCPDAQLWTRSRRRRGCRRLSPSLGHKRQGRGNEPVDCCCRRLPLLRALATVSLGLQLQNDPAPWIPTTTLSDLSLIFSVVAPAAVWISLAGRNRSGETPRLRTPDSAPFVPALGYRLHRDGCHRHGGCRLPRLTRPPDLVRPVPLRPLASIGSGSG